MRLAGESDNRIPKSFPEEISADYIKQNANEISNFSSKSIKYAISPNTLTSYNKYKSINDSLEYDLKYQIDPNIDIKIEPGVYQVIITDINKFITKEYPELSVENEHIKFSKGKYLNLEDEFGEFNEHIFKISAKNQGVSKDFYVIFNKFSYELQNDSCKIIKQYNELISKKGEYYLKLPKIIEASNDSVNQIGSSKNPMTGALYRFRKINRLFHPELYLAKLSVFENHDYIRRRYSKNINKYCYDHSIC